MLNFNHTQAGFVIVQGLKENKYYLIDVFSWKFYNIKPDTRDQITATYYGFSLSDRMFVQIMGKQEAGEFLKEREEYYEKWQRKHFQHKNFKYAELM